MYRPQSGDTTVEIDKMMFDRYRKMTSVEKTQLVTQMNRMCALLAKADIRRRHPNASEWEVQLRFASRYLDRETMIQVYGWDPEKEGY
jgi:hypothetical protein